MSGVRIQVEFKPKNLPEQARKMPQIMQQGLGEALDDLTAQVERRAKRLAPKHQGHLADSIATQRSGPLERQVGSGLKYAPAVEMGSKPHWAPFTAIRDWVWLNRRKFGIQGSGKMATPAVDRVARAVQAKIARQASTAKPFLFPALQQVAKNAQAVIRRYARAALGKLGGGAS